MNKFLNTSILIKFFWAVLLGLIISCNSKRESSGVELIKDDLGREVKIKKNPKRVIALSSSLTEVLYMVCDEDQIVGRTQNCDYPVSVLKKPVVNNYPIDFETLLMLKPDIVFAKDGIVSLEEASKIEAMGIPVYFQHYDKVDDVFSGMEKLGKVLNRKEKAQHAADSLRKRLKVLEKSLEGKSKPSVLMIISKEQLFVYGKDSYASDILMKAGGRNAIDSIFNNPFPKITSEYILHINPDVIIGGEGIDLQNSFFEMYPELTKTNAFKNKKCYTVPEDLIARPGPRVVQGIEAIKNILHPDAK